MIGRTISSGIHRGYDAFRTCVPDLLAGIKTYRRVFGASPDEMLRSPLGSSGPRLKKMDFQRSLRLWLPQGPTKDFTDFAARLKEFEGQNAVTYLHLLRETACAIVLELFNYGPDATRLIPKHNYRIACTYRDGEGHENITITREVKIRRKFLPLYTRRQEVARLELFWPNARHGQMTGLKDLKAQKIGDETQRPVLRITVHNVAEIRRVLTGRHDGHGVPIREGLPEVLDKLRDVIGDYVRIELRP